MLDRIVLDHGGRISLADDATMKRSTFESMYPAVHEFRDVRQKLDPGSRFVSAQAVRLGLTE
jgi:FAD/FMN-containing dehydrogenase